MSHDATAWAIRQRGLSPAEKLVLWHLCDRYHPDHGCFPAQETLAADCEMPRSSLNNHLAALEAAGLIRREQRRESGTFRQRSTMYRIAFEGAAAGFPEPSGATASAGKAVRGAVDKTPENMGEIPQSRVQNLDTEPCPKTGESRVQNLDTNLVREPVREERESACARPEGEQTTGTEATDKGLSRLIRTWPGAASENLEALRRRWALLPTDDRKAAIEAAPRIIEDARQLGRKHPISLASYIAGRNWRELAAAEAAEKARPERIQTFAAWSRDWWALLIAKAHRGEKIGFMVEIANRDRKREWTCSRHEFGPFLPEHMRQHRGDGEPARRWIDWIEAGPDGRKRAFLDITRPETLWLFAPCDDPDGLAEWVEGFVPPSPTPPSNLGGDGARVRMQGEANP